MISMVQKLLLITFALSLVGCGEEPLTNEVVKLDPIGSDASKKTTETKKREPSAPVGTLIRRAEKLAGTKNLAPAIEALEEALISEPTNRKALRLLADIAQTRATELERPASNAFFLRSAEAIRTLNATYKDLTTEESLIFPQILYNEACTLALNGDFVRAMKSLNEAFDLNNLSLERLDNDEELDPLRKHDEFIALQKKAEVFNIGKQMAVAEENPFKFDFKLPDLEGKPVALDSLKGKIVVVDFWGSWCAPCRRELPHLVSLYQKYKDQGVEVVGIDYENETGVEISRQVQTFLKDQGINYPCVIGDEKTRKQVPEFGGFPTTLFLDRKGNVRLRLTGYHSFIPLETAVEKLLGEK